MIKPLNSNVVLKKEKVIKTTKSGIVLSQKEEETDYATVVAIGEGYRNEKGVLTPINLKKGEKVLYKSYSTTSVKVKDQEYLIVDAKDILAVVDDK